jgi:hypothetical protein
MLGRVASRDDVIPLAFPVTTELGEQVSSIHVKKGTIILILRFMHISGAFDPPPSHYQARSLNHQHERKTASATGLGS